MMNGEDDGKDGEGERKDEHIMNASSAGLWSPLK
tara:strand:+ start:406 stop:507 length:102 start_codon:yes stop_codon:yes gene_type:complete